MGGIFLKTTTNIKIMFARQILMEHLQVRGTVVTVTANTRQTLINPSAWVYLNPSSYCDVGRFFSRAFKF
jgi:hypothetical protein